MVVNCHIGGGNQTTSTGRMASAFNHWAVSLPKSALSSSYSLIRDPSCSLPPRQRRTRRLESPERSEHSGWGLSSYCVLSCFLWVFLMSAFPSLNLYSFQVILLTKLSLKPVYIDSKCFLCVSEGVGGIKYLPESIQEFLPTYLVSLEGERRWLIE